MKLKLKQIVAAYKRLDNATANMLEEAEAMKILKARKVMRPIVDDYDAFFKDVQEKLKPNNWDDVQKKVQQWQQEGEKTTLSEAERIEINKTLIDYQKKVESAVKEELEKEIDIQVEKLSETSKGKLFVGNKFDVKGFEEITEVL